MNRKGYTTQILDQLQCVDSLFIFASILESKGINSSMMSTSESNGNIEHCDGGEDATNTYLDT